MHRHLHIQTLFGVFTASLPFQYTNLDTQQKISL